ncbi:hypothetical protein Tco_0818842 [Tanacetum coccineum]
MALRSALERIVTTSGPGFGDWQWRLATLPFAFGGLGVYSAGDVLNYAFIASRLQSAALQTKLLRHVDIVWVQSRRQLVAEERKCLVMDSEKNERYNKPAAGEQSHDEVYGCLKGGSGNSGGKRLAISMVEEAWLSEKKEV